MYDLFSLQTSKPYSNMSLPLNKNKINNKQTIN